MSEKYSSIILIDPQDVRSNPVDPDSLTTGTLTPETLVAYFRDGFSWILGKIQISQLQNSRRIRVNLPAEFVPTFSRITEPFLRTYSAFEPEEDTRSIPDYQISEPDESFNPTQALLRAAPGSPLTPELSDRLYTMFLNIFSYNLIWCKNGQTKKAEVMMEELCKSHPRAASILHEAGLEWNEAYRENDANREWAFPEQMCDGVQATDFTVINVVLKQFGQPVIEPLKKQ